MNPSCGGAFGCDVFKHRSRAAWGLDGCRAPTLRINQPASAKGAWLCMGVARAPKRRFFGDCGIRTVAALAFLLLAGCHSVSTRAPDPVSNPSPERAAAFEAPRIPSPDPTSAQVPAGYRIDIVASGLTYPSSVEFDDRGRMYVAEAGFVFGDGAAVARVVRIDTAGHIELVADQLNAPITDLLWHGGRLYISHRGKISVLIGSRVQDIVTGLPSFGDYQNNQLSVGPDGKLYLGQGTVSNSGVVGADNFAYGWLAKHPE